MPNFISEDDIEQAILKKLNRQCGYELLNCYTADAEDLNDGSNRTDKRDVIFVDRLRRAALRLNTNIPEKAIDVALEKFMAKRHAMSPVAANREIDGLINNHNCEELNCLWQNRNVITVAKRQLKGIVHHWTN